jgi:hypothetical protein
MSALSWALGRRAIRLAPTDVGAVSLVASEARASTENDQIRPFEVHFPDEALADLRRRVRATRWPDRETVSSRSQGVQLVKLQELMRYWGTVYDWRKIEARLNALPMFITEIDGLDIHFIHVRSRHANAMPVILTHGWPGSVIELLGVIDPLTNPSAHGGQVEDAFDVVVPSIPGFGFSGKPMGTGWDSDRIARAWGVLMTRLGYARYVAQGGDVGATVCGIAWHPRQFAGDDTGRRGYGICRRAAAGTLAD